MATNKKISELPAATLPIATGVKFEALQGGVNVQVDADDMPGTTSPDASETTKGILEIATQAETHTGTDDVRALTPLKLAAEKGATGGIVGMSGFSIAFKNLADTFTSLFQNAATAARTYTFQNRNGTIADDTDLALKQALINAAVAITDASTMDLTAIKHTLTTSSATRTFTISYTGDDITIAVILNATSSTFTFPATSLCLSEGIPSGTNTFPLAGVSGDTYIIAVKKIGSNYFVVCKNFGQ